MHSAAELWLCYREGGALSLRAKARVASSAAAVAVVIIACEGATVHKRDLSELEELPITCMLVDSAVGAHMLEVLESMPVRLGGHM